MVKRKKLIEKGFFLKKRLTNGQSILLDELWTLHGGVGLAAERIGVKKQVLVNWRLRGKVPLYMCGTVARSLGVWKEGLNWVDHYRYNGYGTPWKDVVQKGYGFSKRSIFIILKGKAPKAPKL